MTEPPGNGWRNPYRYITLVLLGVAILVAGFVLAEVRAVGTSVSQAADQHVQLGVAIERLATATSEQTYLLDQLLPEGRRVGLGQPPTLRRRVEMGREYPGDPWQRRRAPSAREREQRLSPPGDGG